MYLCYVDESGTPDLPGNTSHFILAGISIPESQWKTCDREIAAIKSIYGLGSAEIHIAWILRPYVEQRKIPDFDRLDYGQRRSAVESFRRGDLLQLQRRGTHSLYKQVRKNYLQTQDYVHLTFAERQELALKVADCISQWSFARLFAECIDKVHFDPTRAIQSVSEQAFEQIVSRFEQYLQIIQTTNPDRCSGLLIHDNNTTVAKRHTALMKSFHERGTLWTRIDKILEAPLFVDSQLTSMVQVADVCAYALRRYLENNDSLLFDKVFQRADRKDGIVVGIRHFTTNTCSCRICSGHRRP